MGLGGIFSASCSTVLALPFSAYSQRITDSFLSRHQVYAQQRLLQSVDHIIMYHKGDLILSSHTLNQGDAAEDGGLYPVVERVPTAVKDDLYLAHKSISHIAISLLMVLEGVLYGDIAIDAIPDHVRPLDMQLRYLEQAYSKEVAPILSGLQVMKESVALACECTTLDSVRILHEKSRMRMEPHHIRYVSESRQLQESRLDDIMSRWLDKYGLNLGRTYMAIVGSRGPRVGLIEQACLDKWRAAKLQHTDNTNHHGLIYVEMLPEQISTATHHMIISDIARVVGSRYLATSVFNDPLGLERDVLSRDKWSNTEHGSPPRPNGVRKCPYIKT